MNTTTYTNIIYYIKSILKSQDIVNFSNIAETVSHDSLTRTMYKEFHLQKHFLDFLSPNLDLSDAYLVIDDTMIKLALELLSYARNVLGFRRMFVLFDRRSY